MPLQAPCLGVQQSSCKLKKWHTLAVGSGSWLLQASIVCRPRNLLPARKPIGHRGPQGNTGGRWVPRHRPAGRPDQRWLLGALGFGTEASADPGHWALGLEIPAGAGCRGMGPLGATRGRARLVGGLTHSGAPPSARLGLYALALRPQQTPGHWAPGEPSAKELQTTGPWLRR